MKRDAEWIDPEDLAAVESSGSSRWLLAAAFGVALGVGALWWSITLRQISAPTILLRDAGEQVTIAANGRSLAFRDLPAPMQDALAETFRSGRLALPPEAGALTGKAFNDWMRAAGDSRLLRGIGKARAGFTEDAAEDFRMLAHENPAVPLARKLLEQAESARDPAEH